MIVIRQFDLFQPTTFPVTPIVPPIGLSYAPIVQQIDINPTPSAKKEIIFIPYIQVRPNYTLIYDIPSSTFTTSNAQLRTQFQSSTKVNRYTGILNQKSISKLRRAIELLVAISPEQHIEDPLFVRNIKFKLNFITLTLSAPQDEITDKQIKRELVNHFLVSAKRKWGMSHYVWKVEKQRNGNFHIHFTTNCYIPHEELRSEWNRIQNKFGFVDQYTQKFSGCTLPEYKKLAKIPNWATSKQVRNRWTKGNSEGWKNPNSTDIKKVNSVKSLAGYMCKYMCKIDGRVPWINNQLARAKAVKSESPGKQKLVKKISDVRKKVVVDGKVWDCSASLKAKVSSQWVRDWSIDQALTKIFSDHPESVHDMSRGQVVTHTAENLKLLQTTRAYSRYSAMLRLIASIQPTSSKLFLKLQSKHNPP